METTSFLYVLCNITHNYTIKWYIMQVLYESAFWNWSYQMPKGRNMEKTTDESKSNRPKTPLFIGILLTYEGWYDIIKKKETGHTSLRRRKNGRV